jgi:hypothetical protein
MENYSHILSRTGILKTFSIARKISDMDIRELHKKYNKLDSKIKKSIKFGDYIKLEISSQMKDDFETNKVPGLLINEHNLENIDNEKIIDLSQFSTIIAKKLIEKKLNKFYHCFVINSLVNMLGLTEKDFDNFHRKFSNDEDDQDD